MVVTIEDMIVAMTRKGWRIAGLAHINAGDRYSCILERKIVGTDGFPIYAANSKELSNTATEAVAEAWQNAQKPVGNDRVFRQVGEPKQPHTDLTKWLQGHLAHEMRLMDALDRWEKALTGVEVEDDDFL